MCPYASNSGHCTKIRCKPEDEILALLGLLLSSTLALFRGAVTRGEGAGRRCPSPSEAAVEADAEAESTELRSGDSRDSKLLEGSKREEDDDEEEENVAVDEEEGVVVEEVAVEEVVVAVAVCIEEEEELEEVVMKSGAKEEEEEEEVAITEVEALLLSVHCCFVSLTTFWMRSATGTRTHS
mmetsp:Transcript_19313/g.41473  ORF Transcript_19313/g.41473 Transcript_19313/m.41473 type:complete len:182 (+) Transcript_19313:1017-1562(+)